MHMHEKIKLLQSMIQPVFHSLHPGIGSCIISRMKTIANITYKCLRNSQVHMGAISSASGICNDGSHIFVTEKCKHIFPVFLFSKPVRMTYLQKELKIFGQ